MKIRTTSLPNWMKSLSCTLAFLFTLSASFPVQAAMIPSELITESGPSRTEALASIQRMLETKVLRDRLAQLNFTPSEIEVRLAAATDEEVHMLAREADKVEAGAGVLEILVAILLVLLILEVADAGSIDMDSHRVVA